MCEWPAKLNQVIERDQEHSLSLKKEIEKLPHIRRFGLDRTDFWCLL
jgi:hypothetical protein